MRKKARKYSKNRYYNHIVVVNESINVIFAAI